MTRKPYTRIIEITWRLKRVKWFGYKKIYILIPFPITPKNLKIQSDQNYKKIFYIKIEIRSNKFASDDDQRFSVHYNCACFKFLP